MTILIWVLFFGICLFISDSRKDFWDKMCSILLLFIIAMCLTAITEEWGIPEYLKTEQIESRIQQQKNRRIEWEAMKRIAETNGQTQYVSECVQNWEKREESPKLWTEPAPMILSYDAKRDLCMAEFNASIR